MIVQKMDRACSIQSRNEYKALIRKSPVKPFVTAVIDGKIIIK
jgi:hypothetical protein